jgi:hypothetical protein
VNIVQLLSFKCVIAELTDFDELLSKNIVSLTLLSTALRRSYSSHDIVMSEKIGNIFLKITTLDVHLALNLVFSNLNHISMTPGITALLAPTWRGLPYLSHCLEYIKNQTRLENQKNLT